MRIEATPHQACSLSRLRERAGVRVRAFRAHAAHVDHHIEGQHAPIGQAQRAAALAPINGEHAGAPMPIDILRAIVQRRHRGHGVDLPLGRQQPSVRGALH